MFDSDAVEGALSKAPMSPTTVSVHPGFNFAPTRKVSWHVTAEESDAEATNVALWGKQLPTPSSRTNVVPSPREVASEFSLGQGIAHGLAAIAGNAMKASKHVMLRI